MDYVKFYADISAFITRCNHYAKQLGMNSDEYWDEIVKDASELMEKYDYKKNQLVKEQIMFLLDFMDGKHRQRGAA